MQFIDITFSYNQCYGTTRIDVQKRLFSAKELKQDTIISSNATAVDVKRVCCQYNA